MSDLTGLRLSTRGSTPVSLASATVKDTQITYCTIPGGALPSDDEGSPPGLHSLDKVPALYSRM